MDSMAKQKIRVIPKEKAVFWMDGNGRWHNRHGPFEHKKIIDYFNAAIQNDAKGYFVAQNIGDIIEKVYFPYQGTALFVVDIIMDDPVQLILNTRATATLETEKLFICNEDLYIDLGDRIAKFGKKSLLKISKYIEFEDGVYAIRIGSDQAPIVEKKSLG